MFLHTNRWVSLWLFSAIISVLQQPVIAFFSFKFLTFFLGLCDHVYYCHHTWVILLASKWQYRPITFGPLNYLTVFDPIAKISKMSADSPCKASKNLIGKIVLPGPVVDRSIIDSVAGFINDVVPHVSNCLDIFVYHCNFIMFILVT